MEVRIIFPKLIFENNTKTPIVLDSNRIANPKAIAAQSYKADIFSVPFYESKVAEEIKVFFTNQYDAPSFIKEPKAPVYKIGNWVQYPFTVLSWVEGNGCFVWLGGSPRVRHLRFYSNDEDARKDNNEIYEMIKSKF